MFVVYASWVFNKAACITRPRKGKKYAVLTLIGAFCFREGYGRETILQQRHTCS